MYFLGDLKERNLRTTIYLNERNKTTTNGGVPVRKKHHNGRVERNVGHGCICYKDDEDRFSQKYTLKMKTFSYYDVGVEIDKDLQLTYVALGE